MCGSITWSKNRGLNHSRIDDGEDGFNHKRTPILQVNGSLDTERVLNIFHSRCDSMEKVLIDDITCKIRLEPFPLSTD